EGGAELGVVIADDVLETIATMPAAIGYRRFAGKGGVVGDRARGLIVLFVGAVAVDGGDAQVVRAGLLALAEKLVVLLQRGDAADGEERAILPAMGLSVVGGDDAVHHLAQALLVIEDLLAVDVLH